jgi:hypothetical protein
LLVEAVNVKAGEVAEIGGVHGAESSFGRQFNEDCRPLAAARKFLLIGWKLPAGSLMEGRGGMDAPGGKTGLLVRYEWNALFGTLSPVTVGERAGRLFCIAIKILEKSFSPVFFACIALEKILYYY